MSKLISMDKTEINTPAIVRTINAPDGIRRRLTDIGLTENTKIECIGRSPMNDPSAYLICGAVIAIRAADCTGILVEV